MTEFFFRAAECVFEPQTLQTSRDILPESWTPRCWMCGGFGQWQGGGWWCRPCQVGWDDSSAQAYAESHRRAECAWMHHYGQVDFGRPGAPGSPA